MISHSNSRIIVFQGSQSHWYLHYDQFANRKMKSMPLESPSLTGLQTQHLGGAAFLSGWRGDGRPFLRLHLNAPGLPATHPELALAEAGIESTQVLSLRLEGQVRFPWSMMGTSALTLSEWPLLCRFYTHSLPPFISFLPFWGPSSSVLEERAPAGRPAGVTHHPALGFVVRWGDRCVTIEMDGLWQCQEAPMAAALAPPGRVG